MIFNGSIVALVTPLDNDMVDNAALQELVVWHAAQGTDAIVVVGSTGEALLLSETERIEALQAAIAGKRQSGNKIKIIAGVGTASTRDTIKMAQNAEDCGVDGVMVSTPSYVKPTQAGALAHFQAIAQHCPLPMIIYNNPGRTGMNLLSNTIIEICNSLGNVVAIKDSSNNLESISILRSNLPPRVSLLSGDDSTNIGFLAQGGDGIISVTANVFPALCKKFISAWNEGNYKESFATHQLLMPVHKAMSCEPNPCPAKYALAKMGKIKNNVRMPLIAVGENTASASTIINSILMVDKNIFEKE
jgi:4-hydroxy-tetrahydrodipicolinate synthase